MMLFPILFVFTIVLALDAHFELEPIEAGFKELSSYKTTCTYDALRDFVDLCREYGADNMNADLRLALAVKLSLCEFIEAGVEYPATCNNFHEKLEEIQSTHEQYQECIADFRAVPQLWTTYSGNYRKLRLLCFEEQAPFMKDSILDLFLNVTRLYSRFYASAQDAAASMERSQDEAATRLTHLQILIENILHQVKEFNGDLSVQHEKQILVQRKTQDTILDRLQIMNDIVTSIFHNNSEGMKHLQKSIQSAQNSFSLLDNSISMSNERTSNMLKTINVHHQKLAFSAQASVNTSELIFNSLKTVESCTSELFSKIDQIYDKSEDLQRGLIAYHATAKSDVQILLDFIHDALVMETRKFGEVAATALDPYLSGIATVGLELESKLLNVSNLVSDINDELKSLQYKMATIGNFSFRSFREFVGWIYVLIKVLGLAFMIIFVIVTFRNFLGAAFLSLFITEAASYLIVLVVGFLVALSGRFWYHNM